MNSSSTSNVKSNATDDACVELENVGLCFRLHRNSRPSFKQWALSRLLNRQTHQPAGHWLFEGFNLTVQHGERLGIVGRNGAGKSTLLKLIAGIYCPMHGNIRVTGRIAPLIEMGAGMLPELTGEDNVFLLSALLGRTRRETAELIDPIFEFAGLQEARTMPVKYYSSGMQARLAFSVSTDINPDVLLIDEIFAAGDLDFVDRAKERISNLLQESRIAIMVSHRLPLIRQFCSSAIWIDDGRIAAAGDPDAVLRAYENVPATQEQP